MNKQIEIKLRQIVREEIDSLREGDRTHLDEKWWDRIKARTKGIGADISTRSKNIAKTGKALGSAIGGNTDDLKNLHNNIKDPRDKATIAKLSSRSKGASNQINKLGADLKKDFEQLGLLGKNIPQVSQLFRSLTSALKAIDQLSDPQRAEEILSSLKNK